jgi:hypothetical protein
MLKNFGGEWLASMAKIAIVLGFVLIFVMLFKACETGKPRRVTIGGSMDLGDSLYPED